MGQRLIWAAAVVAVAVATGCGSSDDGKSAASGGSDAGASTSSGSTSDAPVSGGSVKVGAILSLSGTFSTLGPPEQKGIRMGVEALNKQGFEVAGKKYTMEVVYADDKSDAATTGATQFRQMTQTDKLPLVAIGLGSASYGPLLKRNPVPVINILDSTYPSILQYDPHLFLLRSDSPLYVPGCLNYLKNELGGSTISVISPKGEPYGEGLTKLVQKSGPLEGVTVKTVAQYPLGASDYSSAITRVLAGKPDGVYLSSVTAVQLPVMKQLRQAGYTGPVFHSSGVNPNQAKAILGANYDKLMNKNYDCAGTLPTTSDIPEAKAFADDYQARWNEYPQDLTMWAYDFPFVVAEAMTKAGSTTDADKIFEALKEIPVPAGTVSGWLKGDGKLFGDDRIAETLSEITQWCPGKKTIASAMVYEVKDGKTANAQVRDDACAKVD